MVRQGPSLKIKMNMTRKEKHAERMSVGDLYIKYNVIDIDLHFPPPHHPP